MKIERYVLFSRTLSRFTSLPSAFCLFTTAYCPLPTAFHLCPLFYNKPFTMDIIIETPKGSRQKYTYNKELKLFRLKKVLAPGLVFPFDFGFIPGTKGEDGDPFDVLVLSEYQTFPGCIVDVRI